MTPKLSRTQQRVMAHMRHGREARQLTGRNIYINGVKVCTIATIGVLKRLGLVDAVDMRTWVATEKGRSWK